MTRRSKIAAEHRDKVNDVEAVADLPSTGVKRARKRIRSWVVEYMAPLNTERYYYFHKHDGKWHEYMWYETQWGAEAAMRQFRLQEASMNKLRCSKDDVQWRVVDSRLKGGNEDA